MNILCPEYILWENGEIYSGYAVFVHDDGKIEKIRAIAKLPSKLRRQSVFLKGLMIPGMVNAHCHLELSWLKNKITEAQGMDEFFSKMKGVHTRRPADFEVLDSVNQSIAEMYENGINVCADISNTGISYLPKENSKIQYHTFIEVFEKQGVSKAEILEKATHLLEKFNDSEKHTASISLHTLFTSTKTLMNEVMKMVHQGQMLQSIHFLESREEVLFFTEGRSINSIHEKQKPEFSSNRPADIAAEVLPGDRRVLFVHNTYASERDIIEINQYFVDPWFCFCPVSNEFITGDLPNLNDFIKHTENLVLGTDSYASNKEMNLFSEMQVLINKFPNLDFGDLLKMATINGARLLGIQKTYGSISPGKKPGLIQIRDYTPERKNILFEDIRRLF
ncbi:MAG: hypothetical protein C0592_07415 [Marinilabiliales bacterium]|nr:MAG: hypothetical protein C0592_07415 [Marinilabiliales bacterium]